MQKNVRGLSQKGSFVGNLHERVRLDLTQQFAGSLSDALGASSADLVIPQGRRVAVVEIKIGDPDLPLPSSTSSQMQLLAEQARRSFSGDDVITVLVTNYNVTPGDKQELEEEGIKIVPVASALSLYDPQHFSRDFADIVGLRPTPAALDASL